MLHSIVDVLLEWCAFARECCVSVASVASPARVLRERACEWLSMHLARVLVLLMHCLVHCCLRSVFMNQCAQAVVLFSALILIDLFK